MSNLRLLANTSYLQIFGHGINYKLTLRILLDKLVYRLRHECSHMASPENTFRCLKYELPQKL